MPAARSGTSANDDQGRPHILPADLADPDRAGRQRRTGVVLEERIRKDIIATHKAELEAFGGLHAAPANPGAQGGRTTTAYYLNEE